VISIIYLYIFCNDWLYRVVLESLAVTGVLKGDTNHAITLKIWQNHASRLDIWIFHVSRLSAWVDYRLSFALLLTRIIKSLYYSPASRCSESADRGRGIIQVTLL
jgi:hypothetical protein